MADNTGYQQSIIAKKVTVPSGYPLDVNGELTIVSGKLQAILLLEGQTNPDTEKYEVEGTFRAGEVVSGNATRQYNTDKCPLPVTILPDPYESSWVPKNKGKVLHYIDVWGGGFGVTNTYDLTPGNYDVFLTDKSAGANTDGFWPSFTVGMGSIRQAYGSYDTIECDEIAFFARPLGIHVGQNGQSWDSVYLSTEYLKNARMFNSNDVPRIDAFQKYYGGYYPWGGAGLRGTFYPKTVADNSGGSVKGSAGFYIYDISEGNTQPAYDSNYELTNRSSLNDYTGGTLTDAPDISPLALAGVWRVPTTDIILQLLGQLPRYNELNGTGTRSDDVLDFFLCDADNDPIKRIPAPIGDTWYHKNISGLNLLPNGKMQALITNGQVGLDYFGVATAFATMRNNGSVGYTMISLGYKPSEDYDIAGLQTNPFRFVGMAVGSSWNTDGHNSTHRYCRVKTAEERGYKLIVDGDDILVADPSDTRSEMPIGLERGIALRYMNREHRKVLIKYSELQIEADELRSSVLIEV